MLRGRIVRALALLVAMATVLYLLVSLYLPSSRRLVVGVDKSSGSVRVVQSHVTFLPPSRFYRLAFDKRDGYAQRDDTIRITSRDGVPVTIGYRLRFGIAGDRIPDARRLVDAGWKAWLAARVGEAVSAVTSQIPIEELLSPTSSFQSQRDLLRQTVTKHLAASGLKVTAFEIARFEVDRDALLRVKRAELRRDARSAPTRVAVFALDGADWELLSELADDGRIPNIEALLKGGASGSVQTIQPTVSPMLWTTAASGVPPDRHGVLDFTDHVTHAPVDGYSRHAAALWDIADAFSRASEVVNWWTVWPPAAKTSVFFDTPAVLLPQAIYPPTLQSRGQSLAVPVDTVGYSQIRRFLNITEKELETAVSGGSPSDAINVFRRVLAKTWSDHRLAINLYNEQKPLLLMMSYEGSDAVNHLFSPYHPPYREGVSQEGYRKYWPAVSNYYAEIDRLIGEWMNVLPPDTTVILTSTHGFRWGKNRPRSMPNGGAALSDHRNPGVFIAYGRHVAPSRAAHVLSVYDLAPTILMLLGLPASTEMPGHPATWAFRDVAPIQSVRVVSYSEFVPNRPISTEVRTDAKAYQQYLQAIGHLNDPARNLTPVLEEDQQPETAKPLSPEKWGAYAYYNNLGVELRGKAKLREATDAFDRAIDLNPARPVPYLNRAMTLFDRQMYGDADDSFIQAVAQGLPNAEAYFVDYAALYRQKGSPSRAIAILYRGKEAFPQSYLITANLGSALVAVSRYSEGVPELERALGLQPSSTLVLNNLGVFYARKNDWGRALDYWNRSLSIESHQPQIRDAAIAARARL
jgi:predicted AlkP superfamily phosphohydrolase/phosphomutase/tetratricopeptide (TPR) repeat protein